MFSFFVILLMCYGIVLALFYMRPKAQKGLEQGFEKWKGFLLSCLVALILAVSALFPPINQRFSTYSSVNLSSVAISQLGMATFYLRPRSVVKPKLYKNWKLLFWASICLLGLSAILLFFPDL